MQEHIFDTTPAHSDLIGQGQSNYLKDQQTFIQTFFGVWGAKLFIQDISDAMKAGKVCPGVSVDFANTEHGDSVGMNLLHDFLRSYGNDYRRCLGDLLARDWVEGPYGTKQIVDGAMTLSRRDRKAVRVYSPFASLQPLKAIPAKWTVAHAIRAIWNKQYAQLRCNGHYTDDYAFDAAVDFGRGQISNARAFCKGIIESPSGWWASANGAEVSICCHSFDSNAFTPKLG